MNAGAISIRGSGPVGLALALFLLRQGVAAQRIELEPARADIGEALGARTLALGLGAWQLLARIADMPAAARIGTVEISLAGHAGRTRIAARDLAVPALGYVTRYRDLHRALLDAVRRHPFASPSGVASLGLAGGSGVTADGPAESGDRVVVHAEGDTGADARVREFDQSAVLAELATQVDDASVAFERFTDEGPLAMLPLPEARRYSLVWCGRPQAAQRRMGLDDAAFTAELSAMLGPRFGRLQLVGARLCAPLTRRARSSITQANQVWIGNAAQALHPVAGQGLSLGLRDAFVLARCLGQTGDLQQYRRERRRDRGALLALTDTLASIFTLTPLRASQSWALATLDLVPSLRNRLAAQLMFGSR